jgi:hypothetical protein
LEGAGRRRWYVAETNRGAVSILAGPFPTRREGRAAVSRIARSRGEERPWWPRMETFEGYPGFYAMHTAERVYYVGRASAMYDQGDAWGAAISDYEREVGVGS